MTTTEELNDALRNLLNRSTKEQLVEAITKTFTLETEKEQRWKPEYNQYYAFYDSGGSLNRCRWYNDDIDKNRYATGNCYRLRGLDVGDATKKWTPKYGDEYGCINTSGHWQSMRWRDNGFDLHVYTTGNCYQPHEQERAVWEQVTCRMYDQQLRDAADYFRSNRSYCHYAGWCNSNKEIIAIPIYNNGERVGLPLFCYRKTCIQEARRILGNDAERYFKSRGL